MSQEIPVDEWLRQLASNIAAQARQLEEKIEAALARIQEVESAVSTGATLYFCIGAPGEGTTSIAVSTTAPSVTGFVPRFELLLPSHGGSKRSLAPVFSDLPATNWQVWLDEIGATSELDSFLQNTGSLYMRSAENPLSFVVEARKGHALISELVLPAGKVMKSSLESLIELSRHFASMNEFPQVTVTSYSHNNTLHLSFDNNDLGFQTAPSVSLTLKNLISMRPEITSLAVNETWMLDAKGKTTKIDPNWLGDIWGNLVLNSIKVLTYLSQTAKVAPNAEISIFTQGQSGQATPVLSQTVSFSTDPNPLNELPEPAQRSNQSDEELTPRHRDYLARLSNLLGIEASSETLAERADNAVMAFLECLEKEFIQPTESNQHATLVRNVAAELFSGITSDDSTTRESANAHLALIIDEMTRMTRMYRPSEPRAAATHTLSPPAISDLLNFTQPWRDDGRLTALADLPMKDPAKWLRDTSAQLIKDLATLAATSPYAPDTSTSGLAPRSTVPPSTLRRDASPGGPSRR